MNQVSSLFVRLKFLFKNDSMKSRLLKSGMLVGSFGAAENILRLIRNMIIVRILAPEVFGVMAIILAFNSYFEAFTEIGIKQAIIQNPDGEKKTFLNGAWWLSFGRAIVLYTIAFLVSPLIADFYNKPDLTPFLLRIAFITIILNGMFSSNAFVAMKKMKFIRWVLLFNGGATIGIGSAVYFAYTLGNIWALVLGLIIEAVARVVLSYVLCPFKPGFEFNKDQFKALLKYARGMFGIPLLFIIWLRLDVQVIGKLMDGKQLGYYAMAVVLAREPLQFFAQIINRIFLPAFSEVQEDHQRINNIIIKSMTGIIFMILPVLFFVMFFASDILEVVWGKEYAVAAIPFVFIFAAEFLRISSIPISTSYLATGHPELHRLFNFVRAIVISVIIVPLVYFFDLAGAGFALLFSMFIGLLVQLYRIKTLTGFNISNYWGLMFKAGISSVFVCLGWFITEYITGGSILKIIIGLSCCILAYLFSYFAFPELKKSIK